MAGKRKTLTSDRWIELLGDLLRGDYSSLERLPVAVHLEPVQVITALFNELSDDKVRDTFKEAIASHFEATPRRQENAQKLFTLLHVIAYTLPIRAKRLVRRRLLDGSLARLYYAEQPLSHLGLAVAGKYDLDEELVSYIFRINAKNISFTHRLISLRVLSGWGSTETVKLLETIVYHLGDEIDARQLARELKGLFHHNGEPLLNWCIAKEQEGVLPGSPQFTQLSFHLRQMAFPKKIFDDQTADSSIRLLAASLHRSELLPADLFSIASLTKTMHDGLIRHASWILKHTLFHISYPEEFAVRRMTPDMTQVLVTTAHGSAYLDREEGAEILGILEELKLPTIHDKYSEFNFSTQRLT